MSLSILVVEQDGAMADALLELLRGYDVRAVRSVDEARRALDERVPDVILSDYQLPGDDYADFLAHAAAAYPQTRRVICSVSDPSRYQALLRSGVIHAAVVKTARFGDLLAAIDPPVR